MAPVPVYTGRADPLPGKGAAPVTASAASSAAKVPLPRLRPPHPVGAGGILNASQ